MTELSIQSTPDTEVFIIMILVLQKRKRKCQVHILVCKTLNS